MKAEALVQIPYVLGAVVFGSAARGNSDGHSDFDVFILCEDLAFNELVGLRCQVADVLDCHPSSVSTYCLSNAMAMAQDGSLFMWHLKLEGQIAFSRGEVIEKLFRNLRPHRNYKADFVYYGSLLRDIEESLERFGKPNEFDLALLFTICRNTCMLLSFLAGKPRFGRRSAFVVADERLGSRCPVNRDTYETLLGWKLWYERGTARPKEEPALERIAAIADQVAELINLGLDMCS